MTMPENLCSDCRCAELVRPEEKATGLCLTCQADMLEGENQ